MEPHIQVETCLWVLRSVFIKEVRMSDQSVNEECLELLDAMEIGFELSDYEQSIEELAEEIFK